MWILVHPTYLVLSSAALSNEIFCGLFLVKNLVFLCATVVNVIPQPQEQERCRRQTQCSSTLWECLCTWPSWCCPLQPFQMRIFVVHFDWKSWYFVPGTTAKQILSLSHRNRKDVGGKHNVLVHYVNASAPNLFDVLFCNPFKWHILLFISDQKSCYLFLQQQWKEFYSSTTRTEKW